MKINNELKEVNVKKCTIILITLKLKKFDFDNILLDEKSYENMKLIHLILYH